jgi:hypothetical protein
MCLASIMLKSRLPTNLRALAVTTNQSRVTVLSHSN